MLKLKKFCTVIIEIVTVKEIPHRYFKKDVEATKWNNLVSKFSLVSVLELGQL